jgi:hypothetical protein
MTGFIIGKFVSFHNEYWIIDHNCNHETGLWLDERAIFHRLIGTVLEAYSHLESFTL